MNLLKRLWQEESGATATEYGVLIGVLAVVVVGLATMLRDKLSALLSSAETELTTVAP